MVIPFAVGCKSREIEGDDGDGEDAHADIMHISSAAYRPDAGDRSDERRRECKDCHNSEGKSRASCVAMSTAFRV